MATVLQSLGHNAHVINDVYGGTSCYMIHIAEENQGLETTFLDLENADEGQANDAIQDNIKSPTNPTLRLVDIPRIVAIAKAHPSRPLALVDNTFMSPFYSSHLLQGADIVLHSLTKYGNGPSDVVMGAVILPQHHTALYDRLAFLQDAFGTVPSAFDCWLARRGAKTLHLRMKEHGRNALLVQGKDIHPSFLKSGG